MTCRLCEQYGRCVCLQACEEPEPDDGLDAVRGMGWALAFSVAIVAVVAIVAYLI